MQSQPIQIRRGIFQGDSLLPLLFCIALIPLTNTLKFAQHLMQSGHAVGPMEDILDVVHITNKGKMMDTLERFYFFKETKNIKQINDNLTLKTNVIFETVFREDPYRGHSDSP